MSIRESREIEAGGGRRRGRRGTGVACSAGPRRSHPESAADSGAVVAALGELLKSHWIATAVACASPSVRAILGSGMQARVEDSWDDIVDAGMWALVPLLLSLGGGFLLFISIFAGELEGRWDFFAGGLAAFLGLTITTLMFWSRGFIIALVLIAVGAFGGWVWEQFRDGVSIDAIDVAVGGGGLGGSRWVGRVYNHEERTVTVTCQLRALSPEGDVIGTADVMVADVPPNSTRYVPAIRMDYLGVGGEVDDPDLNETGLLPQETLRGSCTTEIVD